MTTKPMRIPGSRRRRGPRMPFLSAEVQDEVRLLMRRMRAESGGTWRSVAKALGVQESHLVLLATDNPEVHARLHVSPEMMIRVAFAMNVSIDALLGRPVDEDGDCIACGAPPNWRKRLATGKR